jgi:hypothetical protein
VAAAVADVRQRVELGQDRDGRPAPAADARPPGGSQPGDTNLGLDLAVRQEAGQRLDGSVLLVAELRVVADRLGGLPELLSTSVHLGNRLSLQLVDLAHARRPPSQDSPRWHFEAGRLESGGG